MVAWCRRQQEEDAGGTSEHWGLIPSYLRRASKCWVSLWRQDLWAEGRTETSVGFVFKMSRGWLQASWSRLTGAARPGNLQGGLLAVCSELLVSSNYDLSWSPLLQRRGSPFTTRILTWLNRIKSHKKKSNEACRKNGFELFGLDLDSYLETWTWTLGTWNMAWKHFQEVTV